MGIAHGEADAVAALDAETVDQSRRDLPRRHIDLFERQPLVAFDQEGRIAVLRGEKGDIIREVGRRIGDEGQLAPKAFDGPDLDRSARSEEHTYALPSLTRTS